MPFPVMTSDDAYSRQFASQFATQGKFGVMEPPDLRLEWVVLPMKCLVNVEFDGLVFLECIYPGLTIDNTAVTVVGLMGAGKLARVFGFAL